jgi:pyridoxine kinase
VQNSDVPAYPLVGSIQNTLGAGFMGNQAVFAIANALGARVISASTAYASAHAGVPGRANWVADPAQFRKDVAFLVSRQPSVLVIGYVPRPDLAEIIAAQLHDYHGVVLLDPVIGDRRKGLYVSLETARAIRDALLPAAQIVTPNRFEAEILLGGSSEESAAGEYAFLNALYDLGPKAIAVTSYRRDAEKHRTTLLFTNGYAYRRIHAPFYPAIPGHGAGDVFAAGVAVLTAIGASPYGATLLATALCARAVANTSVYAGGSVDPVAALEKWKPLGYQTDDERAARFCERTAVESEAIKPAPQDAPRLKFAPPANKIVYG